MKVRKRNKNVVEFDAEKIVVAVEKAMAETEAAVSEQLAALIGK